ncbi:MAG: rRNA maturation RNase YbeY [bacterium]
MKILIDIQNNQSIKVDLIEIEKIANRVWRHEGKKDAQINIILVNDEYIRKLNKKYLHKDAVTDVIAFPISAEKATFFEGEMYVCIDRVLENATSYNVNFNQELNRVVVHGLLHFIGYEDKTYCGKKIMTKRENHYLK